MSSLDFDGHLRALAQHYSMEDCWCGYGFEDVVESYVANPGNPREMIQSLRENAGTATPLADDEAVIVRFQTAFPDLEIACCLGVEDRRSGLAGGVARLHTASLTEAALVEELERLDLAKFRDMSGFWTVDGSEAPPDRAATLFIARTSEIVGAIKPAPES